MIVAYKRGDYKFIDIQKAQKDESVFGACFDDLDVGFSLVFQEKIYGVFGFNITQDNQAHCFALLGKNCGFLLIELVRFFLKYAKYYQSVFGFNKYCMTVNVHFNEAKRLAGLLGFCPQEILCNFFNDNDYQRYERRML